MSSSHGPSPITVQMEPFTPITSCSRCYQQEDNLTRFFALFPCRLMHLNGVKLEKQ